MPIACGEMIKKIEMVYPKRLAESYDNVGLLVGDYKKSIKRVLVCLEVNSDIVDEAIRLGVDIIISHHPLIFTPLKNITNDDYISQILIKCIKNDISLYALHTNFDNANGGMNDILADIIELKDTKPLKKIEYNNLFKLVVFVPQTHAEIVRNAMLNSGAGHIGNYSHCSFNLEGKGTFLPLYGTSPFIGRQGELERVDEVRIETIVKEEELINVVNTMLKAHPYEEAAYDVYPLENSTIKGLGRIGVLDKEMNFMDFCNYIKEKFNLSSLNTAGDSERIIKTVAVLGGDGNDFIEDAIASGCDVFISGDIKHHKALVGVLNGINIIDAGHYNTENLAIPYISDFINSIADVDCFVSNINTNPYKRV